MTEISPSEPAFSPELRATIYSFTQFLGVGAATAYSGIWFAQHGLTNEQVGVINAAPVFVLLLINIFIGKLADRATDWRHVLIAGSWLAAIFSLGLFFTDTYFPILLVWSLVGVAFGAIGPVADAANSRLAARRGSSYGSIRAWGTIGYIVAVFVTGPLVAFFTSAVFVPFYVAMQFVRGIAALFLPRFRGASETETAQGSARHLGEMFRPWLFMPLLAWAMIQSTNVTLMSFQAKFFHEQGLPDHLISILLAIGAIAETPVLFLFSWFKRNFKPQTLILAAGIACIIRWVCFAYAPGMPWLVPLQMLNAVTYGVGFLGLMNFITAWTAESMAAEAMGFFTVLFQIAVVVMTAGFGHIANTHGVGAFWASAAMAFAGICVLLTAMRFAPPPIAAQPG